MRARSGATHPPDTLTLTTAATRFAAWRRRRPRGERIPSELWAMATDLARQVGVSQASQALHLDYYSLQRRLSGASPVPEAADPSASTSGFVELSLPQPSQGLRCALEACDGAGVTMRAELTGLTAVELATLLRAMMDRTPCCR